MAFCGAIDAYLKWQPDFITGYLGLLTDAAQGQPGWLAPWFEAWIRLISLSPTAFAYLTAVVETLTALGLIFGFARRAGYLVGLGFSWSGAPRKASAGRTPPPRAMSAPASSMRCSSWRCICSMPV